MKTKAEKTKGAQEEEDDSGPDAKAPKLEPKSTSESSDEKTCLMCGKVHNKNDDLSTLSEDERYKCHYCSESFSYSCLFAAHIRACSSATSSTTEGMNPKSANSTVTAVPRTVSTPSAASNSANDTKGFRCEVCSRVFACRAVLENHIERMHGGKGPTECEFCRKKYNSVVDLILHKKTHVGVALYQCTYCDQKFMNRSMVTEHERIHTGDTPYRCEFCNRGFSYRSNLIVHKRIHDSKRNHFECDQCGQTFQHGAQLTRHKLVHTTGKPLDCRHCGKRFDLYTKLIEHIKEEHPKKT